MSRLSASGASLVIRFGGITDRRVDPLGLIEESLVDTRWKIFNAEDAGSASHGKRQADLFLRNRSQPVTEYDIWARLS